MVRKVEERRSLCYKPTPLLLEKERGRDFREGLRPSLTYTPPSLTKGRGSGG